MTSSETVDCPLCGTAPARAWARQDRWRVVRCSGCGLLITWPRPEGAALVALYADESYYESRAMGGAARKAWDERARAILKALPISPRSVLDVGAGEGHLVRALREMGIAAEGIETSPAGRAAARRLYDLDLSAGISEAAERRFELITFIHSLEHVADPVGALAQLASRLEPAGLVFIEVPHAGSIDAWRPRRRAEILDLPAHLYHFVPATLSRIVERAGLRVVELFLSNPDVVEWVMRMRARSRGDTDKERAATTGSSESASPSSSPAGGGRSLWAGRLVPWVRRRFPGGKLQLLATRTA